MLWLLPLAGAAIGAMSNKQNRWKGALTGAALGATGGAAAGAMGAGAAAGGGLLGGAGAAGAGAAGAGAAGAGTGLLGASAASGGAAAANPLAAYMTTGAVEGSMLAPALSANAGGAGAVGSGSTAGLLGMGQQAMGYAKPIAQAGQAAQQVQGLFGGQQQVQAPPVQQPLPGANQILAQLAQQGMQEQQMTAQAGAERRKRRMGLLGASYG